MELDPYANGSTWVDDCLAYVAACDEKELEEETMASKP